MLGMILLVAKLYKNSANLGHSFKIILPAANLLAAHSRNCLRLAFCSRLPPRCARHLPPRIQTIARARQTLCHRRYRHPSSLPRRRVRPPVTPWGYIGGSLGGGGAISASYFVIRFGLCTCSGRGPSPIKRAGIWRKVGKYCNKRTRNGNFDFDPSGDACPVMRR